MATNPNHLNKAVDRKLFLAAAILFPLFIFIGFFRSYYGALFIDVPPLSGSLAHIHGVVMTLWVLLFSVQIVLVRTKNIKLHMTLGMFGVGLALAVVIVGMVTAYQSILVGKPEIGGMDYRSFFMIPFAGLLLFVVYFAGAIYYRKKPAEHKSLMFMTAINFLPFGFSRMPFIPEHLMIPWAFGAPDVIAIGAFIWYSAKHKKFNKVFAIALAVFIISQPVRFTLMFTDFWINLVRLIEP